MTSPEAQASKAEGQLEPVPVSVAHGDGIGPEIMGATLDILNAAEAALKYETVEIGEKVYLSGVPSGISPESWESIRRTKVFLKAPITTPQGGGYKSLNVTIRKTLGLYANIRPCVTYHPALPFGPDGMDVVIIRENEEDLYAGIEHRQTHDVYQTLKLMSEPGCRRIVRYAFEYARIHNRKKVTCMTKDNIMKMTDGLFHRMFKEIGKEYPDIEQDHYIIDIGMARAATRPTDFDVIVVPNLYGDIVSDVIAEISGSVGLAGSANIGSQVAMFEAIHGSAPDIAGKGIANPSGLLLGAVQMLVHVGQGDCAAKIHNAWLKTLEDGIHTGEIANSDTTKQKVGTQGFADAVIERLGQLPTVFKPKAYASEKAAKFEDFSLTVKRQVKETIGIDIFVCSDLLPDELANKVKGCQGDTPLQMTMITNRGVKVWPDGFKETFCSDHWRIRFEAENPVDYGTVIDLMSNLNNGDVEIIKTENLCTFDGVRNFSSGQGE